MGSWNKKNIRGLLLDITGVLKDGKLAIPGSVEAFRKLRNSDLPLRLVTNETQVARTFLHEELTRLGFDVAFNEIFAPAPALVNILKKNNLRPHLLVHPKLLPEFSELDLSNPNALVLGDAADHFTYTAVNDAFRFLLENKDAKFYTLGRGKYYSDNSELFLDVGPFTAALEFALPVKAELVGKPSLNFFESALSDLKLLPEDVVMIGDDILGDIGGAQNAGMRGVLVRTGKFRPADEKHPEVTPDGVVDDLAQAVSLILGELG